MSWLDDLEDGAWRGTYSREKVSLERSYQALAAETTPQAEARRRLFSSLQDPREASVDMLDQALAALRQNLEPVEYRDPSTGRGFIFEMVGDLEAEEPPDPRDFGAIREALAKKRTHGSRIRGNFRVREVDAENNTIKIHAEGKHTVAIVPTPIYDRSFIVKGKPRSLATQFRRKPGVFTHETAAGELVTEFNLDRNTSSRIDNFKVALDNSDQSKETPEFRFQYGQAKKIPAWDVAAALGATPRELERAVGKETAQAILADATPERQTRTLRQLHTAFFGDKSRTAELSDEDVKQGVVDQFLRTRVDPSITRATTGVSSEMVDRDLMLASFRRLVRVAGQEEEEDDRESLTLKEVMTPRDLIAEAVGRDPEVRSFQRGILQKLVRGKNRLQLNPDEEYFKINQMVGDSLRNKIEGKLSTGMLQQSLTSTNPLDSMAHATMTTVMGEGAITSDMAVPAQSKLISPSSLAFLDPVHTPESSRAGVNLHMSSRSRIRRKADGSGSELVTTMLDPSGKEVELTPSQLAGKTIGSFDQFERGKGRPIAKGRTVRAFQDGSGVSVPARQVDYWMPDHLSMFDANTALVPMQNSTQGNRVQYADKQLQQAVPLVHREAPLVQVQAPGTDMSVEKVLAEEMGAIVAPFDGTVVRVDEKGPGSRTLVVKDSSGTERKIPLAKNVPLGGKTPLDSHLRFEPGQTFKRGDTLADSNYTRDGVIALGVNLRTAYLPYKSATFEDAVAISESAARKLTSEHLYTEAREGKGLKYGLKEYNQLAAGDPLSKREREHLDAEGIVKVGTIVKPGDALMVGSRGLGNFELNEAASALERAQYLKMFGSTDKRKTGRAKTAFAHRWKSEFDGEVVDVSRDSKGNVKVHVRTQEPMQVGDKIYGRHGNKGVVAAVLADEEMPKNPQLAEVLSPGGSKYRVGQEIPREEAEKLAASDPDFQWKEAHLELLLNPLGIPSRMNPSQNFETFLGKVARREGSDAELVTNFGYESNWDYVNDRMREAGVEDAEDLVDPVTGRTLKGVGVGTQYITKAKQSVAHKSAARGVGVWQKNGLASKGEDGAQSLGELGIYSLLAQDAREFLRDAQMYTSENRPEVWRALENGQPLPVYKNPEDVQSFTRFQDYLKAAGINMLHEKDQHRFRLKPMTDEDVISMVEAGTGKGAVARVIERPMDAIDLKSNKPKPGGLFDPQVTGGFDGRSWSRFELPQALPNPTYEKPIRDLLGISKSQYERIMVGADSVEIGGQTYSGARAIEQMLETVDLDAVYEARAQEATSSKKDSERSQAYRAIKAINMLRTNGMTPTQAFMRKQVAVPPPALRTIDEDADGNLVIGDLNYLYRDIGLISEQLKDAYDRDLPPAAVARLESGLYDSMRTLMQVEGSAPMSGEYQGILGILSGKRPDGTGDIKSSLMKKELIDRRRAFSARTVLAPDDTLGLDEAAIPYTTAAALMEPHAIAHFKKRSPNGDVAAFRQRLVEYAKEGSDDIEIERILDDVSRDRAVILKRDPALHKYSIQAFRPKLTKKETVSMNPLVYSGFGADNDGDTMAIFLPLTDAANKEALQKMTPSNNLLNPQHGGLEFSIGHESILGLTRALKPGANSGKTYPTLEAAKKAHSAQEIDINSVVTIAGRSTTLGKELFSDALPRGVTVDRLVELRVLSDGDFRNGLSKKQLGAVLEYVAREHQQSFGEVANALRIIGQEAATETGASILMEDLKPMLRDLREEEGKKIEDRVSKINSNRSLTPRERRRALEDAFAQSVKVLDDASEKEWEASLQAERPNTLTQMVTSGARAKFHQLKQITVSPTGLVDGAGDLVPVPVMKNYSEGLDPVSYWSAAAGARKGAVSKVVEVQEPGYLSKQLLNTSMDIVITMEDCGDSRGTDYPLAKNSNLRDVAGRTLASSVRAGSANLRAGSTMSMDDAAELLRQAKDGTPISLKVRSTLSCKADAGVCQVCAGHDAMGQPYPIGTNVGIISGQALGERSTQLTLSTFHGGGVFTPGKGGATDLYNRAQALLRAPGSMGGELAVVANEEGEVTQVQENKAKGGWDLKLDTGNTFFIPKGYTAPDGSEVTDFYRKGTRVTRGQVLSSGLANPKRLLEDSGGNLPLVQTYMTEELDNAFRGEGVLRRNVETVVRSLTSTVEVVDPGGAPVLPAQRIALVEAERLKKLYPGLEYRSVIRGVDVAPREQREDFLAQLNFNNLRNVITDAAAKGATSDYHGTHPIPAMATGFSTSTGPGWLRSRMRERGMY